MNRSLNKQLLVWGHHEYGVRRNVINHPTKLNAPDTPWIQVACGLCHTAALSSNGEVFTCGWGYYGQLGHGDKEDRSVPTKVEIPGGERIVKVACGDYHTAAVTVTGKLYTWYVRRATIIPVINHMNIK